MKKLVLTLMLIALIGIVPLAGAQGDRTVITVDNAFELVELNRLSRGSTEFVTFAPDGASVFIGGTVGVWQYDPLALDTEAEPPVFVTNGEVEGFDLSVDGSLMAVSNNEGQIEIWDVASATRQTTINESASWVQLSPDASVLFFNGSSNAIRAWDIAGNAEIGLLEGHTSTVNMGIFSPDGSVFATAGSEPNVRLWDVTTLSEIALLEGHTSEINDLAFSPDGSVLVSVSRDETIRAWDVAAGTSLAVLEAAEDDDFESVTNVAFSPDGNTVVTAHGFGSFRIWNSSFEQLALVDDLPEGSVDDVEFAPDSSAFLIIGDEHIASLYAVDGTLLSSTVGHTDSLEAVTFRPDSSEIALASTDGFVWVWNTTDRPELNFSPVLEEAVTFGTDNQVTLTYSNDGTVLAGLESFSIKLYDAESKAFLSEIDVDGLPEAVVFSPDDTMIAVTSSDSNLYIFNVVNGALLATLTSHNDWAFDVHWSPDQTLLATSAGDHTVRVWGLPQ